MNETQILEKARTILEKRAMYNTKKDTFSNPESVRQYLAVHFGALQDGNEHFVMMFLDNRHRLLSAETLFHGSIDSAAVYPRVVVQRALHNNCAAVLMAHNHPSGVAEPSDTDVRLTRKLTDALALVDVRVLDHLILGDNSENITSLAERGLM